MSNLWGAFPAIPGTQLSTITTAQNANPLSIMPNPNGSSSYFSTLAVLPTSSARVMPVGNNSSAGAPYTALAANVSTILPPAGVSTFTTNLLPLVIQASTGSPYYA